MAVSILYQSIKLNDDGVPRYVGKLFSNVNFRNISKGTHALPLVASWSVTTSMLGMTKSKQMAAAHLFCHAALYTASRFSCGLGLGLSLGLGIGIGFVFSSSWGHAPPRMRKNKTNANAKAKAKAKAKATRKP